MHRPTLVAGLAGALIGSVVSVVLVVGWRNEPEVTRGPEAAQAFADAWERSRLETYYARSEVVRTNDRGELESELEVVQRPPDVVRRQHGGLWGRQNGRTISCTVDSTDAVTCGPGGAPLPPYEEEVADEMERWSSYLDGGPPLYLVRTEGDGCFDLVLTQVFPSPPYGNEARFCFDAATGAMTANRIVRDEGTEVLRTVELRSEVTDADFALPG